MRYFFGAYPSNKEVARLFDLARLILQPDYARKMHITLRGPYEKKPSSRSKWIRHELSNVRISRPSTFFNDSQNTVFLSIEFTTLEDMFVSWKRDFNEAVPHMTLYDGGDKIFAWQILQSLRKFKWGFEIQLTPVQILEKKKDYDGSFFLELDDIDIAFNYIHERPMNREYIRNMHPGQRIFLTEKIISAIHDVGAA
jgi:hypothetical protein